MRLFWKTRVRINAWRTARRRRKNPHPKPDRNLRYVRFTEGDALCVFDGEDGLPLLSTLSETLLRQPSLAPKISPPEGSNIRSNWLYGIPTLLLLATPATAQVPPPPPDLFPAAVSCTAPCTTAMITTNGYAQVNVEATGTGGSLTFKIEGKQGNSTVWHTLPAVVPTTPGTFVTAMSANGFWVVPAAGYQSVRVNLTAIASGTETFALTASVRTNLNVGQ